MSTRRLARVLSTAGLFASLVGGAFCTRPNETTPPNVLLVTIETLRADHVSSYGYSRLTTPNLDRLASQGARFTTVIAQAPFTLPSIASLMTGRTPPTHGVRNHPAILSPNIETVAERFRLAGYETAAMTRHTWLRNRSGLDQGFEQYFNNKFQAGLDARSLSLAAVDWLTRRNAQKPFFLWLHFLDPHLPYTPNYPYSVIFGGSRDDEPQVKHLRSLVGLDREGFRPTPYADLAGGPYYDLVLPAYPDNEVLLDLAFWRRSRGSIFFGKKRYSRETVREVVDLYDGAILYTDDNLGRILEALSDLGLEKTTVVAVTSDHGEAFGEHGVYFTHDFTLYDEVLRVPLVIRYPGNVPADSQVPQQVRLMDVAPTLLELAGVAPLEAIEAKSLVPLLTGGSLPFLEAFAESAPLRPQFPEQDRVYFSGNRGKWRMVRTERWKLIRIPHPEGDRHELYDLERDPFETRNLFQDLPGEAGRIAPSLDAWMAVDASRNSETQEETAEELDPASLDQLRALGYLEAERPAER